MGLSRNILWRWCLTFSGASTDPQNRIPRRPWAIHVRIKLHLLYISTTDLISTRGLDAIALLLVWLLVPGTERQGITVEEMNYVFGVSTSRHVSYQLRVVAPWFYRYYILRQDVEMPPALYRYTQWEHVTEDA